MLRVPKINCERGYPLKIYTGVSGWSYDGWKGVFYPPNLKSKDQLLWASRKLSTIEINGTFYRLQNPDSFLSWYEDTPDGFIMSVKAPKYITHVRKLKECEIPLANFLANGMLHLKEKLGPILWQLPPQLKYSPYILDFMKKLPQTGAKALSQAKKHDSKVADKHYLKLDKNTPMRHCFEVRHQSFDNEEFLQLAQDLNIAVAITDSADKWPRITLSTAKHLYLRLHGPSNLYPEGYSSADLKYWQDEIVRLSQSRKIEEVFVYFDNEAKKSAPLNAIEFSERIRLTKKVG